MIVERDKQLRQLDIAISEKSAEQILAEYDNAIDRYSCKECQPKLHELLEKIREALAK